MYCTECGTKFIAPDERCPNCAGPARVNERPVEFTMYEYKSVVVPKNLDSLYADCHGAFGWQATNVVNSLVSLDKVTLSFKRNRSIKNNIELNKLQAQLDAALLNLKTIQAEMDGVGFVPALTVGILSALVLGGGMSLCLKADQMVLGVIVGLIGLAGCAFPYFINKRLREKTADRFRIAKDEQYDLIGHICQQAQTHIQ